MRVQELEQELQQVKETLNNAVDELEEYKRREHQIKDILKGSSRQARNSSRENHQPATVFADVATTTSTTGAQSSQALDMTRLGADSQADVNLQKRKQSLSAIDETQPRTPLYPTLHTHMLPQPNPQQQATYAVNQFGSSLQAAANRLPEQTIQAGSGSLGRDWGTDPNRISQSQAASKVPTSEGNYELGEDEVEEARRTISYKDLDTGLLVDMIIGEGEKSDSESPDAKGTSHVAPTGEDTPMINGVATNPDDFLSWPTEAPYTIDAHYGPPVPISMSAVTRQESVQAQDRTKLPPLKLGSDNIPIWSIPMELLPPESSIDRLICSIIDGSKDPSVLSESQIKTDPAAELASPSFLSVASLLNPNEGRNARITSPLSPGSSNSTHTDVTTQMPIPVSEMLGRYGNRSMKVGRLPERMASLHNLSQLVRWHILPTKPHWDAMFPSLRPTDLQRKIRHHAWIDVVPWPQVRDEFIRRQDTIKFSRGFREDFNRYISVNWNKHWREIFRCNGGKPVGLSHEFQIHIADIRHWTVDKEWTGELEFLNSIVPKKVVK